MPVTRALQVGFVESVQQQERKSGAEAWSLRVHDVQRELPYTEFVDKIQGGNVPFHRIAYFKCKGTMVWCASTCSPALDDHCGLLFAVERHWIWILNRRSLLHAARNVLHAQEA